MNFFRSNKNDDYFEDILKSKAIDAEIAPEWYIECSDEVVHFVSISSKWVHSGDAKKDFLKIKPTFSNAQEVFALRLYEATGVIFCYFERFNDIENQNKNEYGFPLFGPDQPIFAYNSEGRCIFEGLFEDFSFDLFKENNANVFFVKSEPLFEAYKIIDKRSCFSLNFDSGEDIWYRNSNIASALTRRFALSFWSHELIAHYLFLKIRRKLPTALLKSGRWAVMTHSRKFEDVGMTLFDVLGMRNSPFRCVPSKDTDVRIFNRFSEEIYQGPIGNFPQKMFEENYGRVLIWLEQYEEEKES